VKIGDNRFGLRVRAAPGFVAPPVSSTKRGRRAQEVGMASAFDEMIEVAKRAGIVVRHARLGGAGGGLASVKGRRHLFVDLDAEPADQLERTAAAMAQVSEINEMFVRPDVREMIERYREGQSKL
jgi:hypothetical protein